MKIYLVRHPITNEIENGIVQGKNIGTISKKGYSQIKKFISQINLDEIDLIISSDAKRCKDMAKKIIVGKKIKLKFTGLIGEKSYGKSEGKKIKEISKKDIKGINKKTKKYIGGESLLDVEKRAKKFINIIKKEKSLEKKTILIISHSIFLSILLGKMLNMGLIDSRKKLRIDHCSINEVSWNKEEGFVLKKLN